MTIVNIEFNTVQVNKIKSTDTISEVCLEICADILGYLSNTVLKNDPYASDRIDTCSIMIRWYIGLLTRACVADTEYEGVPSVQLLYLDKSIEGQDYCIKHAFTLQSLRRVPSGLLTELIHRVVLSTLECITSRNVTLNSQQLDSYVAKIINLLTDIHRLVDTDPFKSKNGLNSVLIRYVIPNNLRTVLDYC